MSSQLIMFVLGYSKDDLSDQPLEICELYHWILPFNNTTETSETGTESNAEEERKVAKDNPHFPHLQSLTFSSNQALKH